MKFIFFPITLVLLLLIANADDLMLWCISNLETSTFTSFLIPYIVAIIFCALLMLSLFFITMKSIYRTIYCIFIPLIVLPLLYTKHPYNSKLYAAHPAENEMSNFVEYTTFTNQRIGDESSADLYCFFSIDCGHCLESAIVINAMCSSGNFPATKFIFRASTDQMNEFVLLNQIKVPSFNIENQMNFDQIAGAEFPFIVLKQGENTAFIWAGSEVNNWLFDFIKSTVK